MAAKDYPLREDHLLAFGAIVQNFARFERLIEISVSRILKANYALTAIVMSNLGYTAKCEALKSLLGIVSWLDKGKRATVLRYVEDFNAYVPLRNVIAHHPWKEGTRTDSVKPMSARSRGGKAKFQGVRDEEQDYTIDDLNNIANALVVIHNGFRDFLISVGEMEIASESIDDTNSTS
jgi:hypothetical protein